MLFFQENLHYCCDKIEKEFFEIFWISWEPNFSWLRYYPKLFANSTYSTFWLFLYTTFSYAQPIAIEQLIEQLHVYEQLLLSSLYVEM